MKEVVPPRIPMELLAPMVREYVKREDIDDMQPASRVYVLHLESGVSESIIRNLSCEGERSQKAVSFAVADKLISTIIGPQHWWQDSALRAFYEPAA